MEMTLGSIIDDLIAKNDLSSEQSSYLMNQVLNGKANTSQIAAIITLMRSKGETATELSSIVETMWENCPEIPNVDVANAIDTCGTGGDNSGSINISTASSIVLAALGIKVAKHGNKAASSKCGAADVLQELGVKIDTTPEQSARLLESTNFCFLFAPIFHPGMRHAAPVRAELGVRTTFNFLGPLANPFKATYRLHGLSDPKLVQVYAETLKNLKVKKAFVFCGHGLMDEISLSGPSEGILLENGELTEMTIDPASYGFELADSEQLAGGDAKHNAEILKTVFSGNLNGPYEDVIVLNSAVALHVMSGDQMGTCIDNVKKTIGSGMVMEKLNEIAELSNKIGN